MHFKVRIRVLFLVAGVIFITGLSIFLLLFFKGEQLLPHQTVFVPKEKTVEKFTTINADNFKALFEPKEMLKAAVTPNMITLDMLDRVMNKTMVMPLYPEDYLTVNHVRETLLTPRQGEIEYPLPASWLEVLDWTGRPGDEAEIWITPTEKLRQFYMQKFKEGKAITDSASLVPETPDRPLSKPVFSNVRLRYVMDGTNRTVRNANQASDRSDATGKPTDIKVFLLPAEYAQLKNAVEEGYKLIIAAKE
ncbi:hypothetical protein [Paenibacillus elgii]|uniref:hypothetical protein n=1 Tax=Paenibacillus elgii TaxID=189691 RepID=UPI0013D785E7|nr:hypothetical protein [Paenibacillus elgii]